MGMAIEDAQMQEARRLLDQDPVSRRTLELLRRQQSAAGWAIAKTLGMNPDLVSKALENLRCSGLIEAESGSGLEGFYFLTGLAYKLMAQSA